MLGNVYIIDSPKELAQVVRDASMFGGTLSPEDLYEFLQVSREAAVDAMLKEERMLRMMIDQSWLNLFYFISFFNRLVAISKR